MVLYHSPEQEDLHTNPSSLIKDFMYNFFYHEEHDGPIFLIY